MFLLILKYYGQHSEDIKRENYMIKTCFFLIFVEICI